MSSLPQEFLKLFDQFKARFAPEDRNERLTFTYTPIILISCILLILTRQYIFGDSLRCYFDDGQLNQLSSAFHNFAESSCYVSGTYRVDFNDNAWINKMKKLTTKEFREANKDKLLSYYQWVPVTFLIMCIVSFVPRHFFRSMCRDWLGFEPYELVEVAALVKTKDRQAYDNAVNQVADTINRMVMHRIEMSQVLNQSNSIWSKFSNYYQKILPGKGLMIKFALLKLFWILYFMIQLLIMEYSITHQKYSGFQNLVASLYSRATGSNIFTWEYGRFSDVFPLRSYCLISLTAVTLRQNLNNKYHLGGECSLNVNLLNDVIYTFLYYWFLVNMLVALISFFLSIKSISTSQTKKFIKHCLDCTDEEYSFYKKQFVKKYLNTDGLLIVTLLLRSSGKKISCDIVRELYRQCARSNLISKDSKVKPVQDNSRSTAGLIHSGSMRSSSESGHSVYV